MLGEFGQFAKCFEIGVVSLTDQRLQLSMGRLALSIAGVRIDPVVPYYWIAFANADHFVAGFPQDGFGNLLQHLICPATPIQGAALLVLSVTTPLSLPHCS